MAKRSTSTRPRTPRRGRRAEQSAFGAYAKAAEMQAKLISDFEALFATDAVVARALVDRLRALVSPPPVAVAVEPRRAAHEPITLNGVPSSAWARVVDMFRKNGNTPVTKKHMQAHAQMSKYQLHDILFEEPNRTWLHRETNPNRQIEKLYRLSDEYWEKNK